MAKCKALTGSAVKGLITAQAAVRTVTMMGSDFRWLLTADDDVAALLVMVRIT